MINLLSSQYIFQVKIVIKRLFKKASVSLNLSNTSTKFVYQVQSVFMFDIVVAQGTFSVSRSFPDKIRRCICSETSFSSWILILILSMVSLGSTSKVMIFPVKSFTYYFMWVLLSLSALSLWNGRINLVFFLREIVLITTRILSTYSSTSP